MGDGSILSLAPGTTLRFDADALDSYGRRQSAGLSLGQGLVRSLTIGAVGSLCRTNGPPRTKSEFTFRRSEFQCVRLGHGQRWSVREGDD